MRTAAILLSIAFSAALCAQDRVLINEVLPANHGVYTDAQGHTPDWIELYNPTTRPVDLMGWRIAINGRQHVIEPSLAIPAKGYRMLWCDGRTELGADHIAFPLARKGQALLLITADGTTVADVFSYPELPGDVSMGRLPDGARNWSFFVEPSPNAANATLNGSAIRGRCEQPSSTTASGSHVAPIVVELLGDGNSVVRYTLDGTVPDAWNSAIYQTPIAITGNTTLRAVAFADDRLPSEALCATYIIGEHTGPALALDLSPADLWSDSTGIYAPGAFSNHTRTGEAWERPAFVQWFGDSSMAAGARISGSGSRGARKRSFKLYARDRYGSAEDGFHFADGTHVHEGILRADASPHAFLRNAVIEELTRRYALHVTVQPSVCVPLYLNATYWGLYRWMPAKDNEWLEQVSDAEALDVVQGPAAVAINGTNKHFLRAQELLLRGAPVDSMEAMIDTRSLIDLACMDLWTGRADHDLNVRCYRPRQKDGRWRWILFDMDLWAPAEENSVERMCSASAAETPYVPQLLAHPELQEALLARITALQAVVFAQAGSVADSIQRVNEHALRSNFKRWELELDMPDPDSSLAQLKGFATTRPRYLFDHLAQRTGLRLRTVVIDVPPASHGQVLLGGLALTPGRHSVLCFGGVPLQLEARANSNYEFAGWKGIDERDPRVLTDLSRTRNVSVYFRQLVP